MPRVKPPFVFPGDFFVLRWDREAETYLLVLDDDVHSSYDLGDDPIVVTGLLRLRGLSEESRDRVVAGAREFGLVQYIPAQDRVIQLPNRTPKASFGFDEEPKSHGWLHAI